MTRRETTSWASILVACLLAPFSAVQVAEGNACRGDAWKFCQGVPPGGGRIADCLKAHDAELSPGCRQLLGGGAAAKGPLATAKTPDASLVVVPDEDNIVCEAAWTQEKSKFGPPPTEIYTADAGGGHITQITHQRMLYNHIAVSPDRKMVAAGRYDQGDTNHDGKVDFKDRKTLVVLDLEHKQEWALVPQADDACIGGVDWTHDGSTIVASLRFGRSVDIYRVHPDGTGLENLTRDLGRLLGIPKPVFVSDVSTSYDGQWIVFLCLPRKSQPSRIARMRIDRTEAHFVTDGGSGARNPASPWGAGDFDPEFSPDGQYVTFERSTSAAFDVFRCRIDGSDLRQLSPKGNKELVGVPDWSVDNRIIFSEWNRTDSWTGPVLVNPDGTDYHRVEKLKGCTFVRWVPSS